MNILSLDFLLISMAVYVLVFTTYSLNIIILSSPHLKQTYG